MLLATMLGVSIAPAAGQGYTPEQEQACTGDAFRLCSAAIPDIGRVTASIWSPSNPKLSPPCRAHFRPDPGPSDVSARTVVRPATPRKAASAKAAGNKAASNKALKVKKSAKT